MALPFLRLTRPVHYYVSDLKRAVDFYAGKLGFKVDVREGKNIVGFKVGSYILRLEENPRRPVPNVGGARATFYVDYIEEVYEELRKRGVSFAQPVTEIRSGFGKFAQFEDTEGNLLEIFEPLSERVVKTPWPQES